MKCVLYTPLLKSELRDLRVVQFDALSLDGIWLLHLSYFLVISCISANISHIGLVIFFVTSRIHMEDINEYRLQTSASRHLETRRHTHITSKIIIRDED